MIFLTVLLVLLAIYFGCAKFFQGHRLPLGVENLLLFKAHYILLGFLLGTLLPQVLSSPFQTGRYLLMRFLVGWLGFALGIRLELQILRKTPNRLLALDIFQAVFTFLFVFSILYSVLSIFFDTPSHLPITLTLGIVASTTAPWEHTVLSRRFQFTGPVTRRLRNASSLGDMASITILGVVTLFLEVSRPAEEAMIAGWGVRTALCITFGAGTGILLDFLFREGLNPQEMIYLTFGAIAIGSGLAATFHFPAIFVGMIAGAWLINSTLRRLKVLEMVETSYMVLEGIFLALVGSLVSLSRGSGLWESIVPLLSFSVVFSILRAVGKVLGANLGSRLLSENDLRGKGFFGLGLLSQGSIAIAAALWSPQQGVILPAVIIATCLSQLSGPSAAMAALRQAGELKAPAG